MPQKMNQETSSRYMSHQDLQLTTSTFPTIPGPWCSLSGALCRRDCKYMHIPVKKSLGCPMSIQNPAHKNTIASAAKARDLVPELQLGSAFNVEITFRSVEPIRNCDCINPQHYRYCPITFFPRSFQEQIVRRQISWQNGQVADKI